MSEEKLVMHDSMNVNYDSNSINLSSTSTLSIPESDVPLDKKPDPQFDFVMLCCKKDDEKAKQYLKRLIDGIQEKQTGTLKVSGVMYDDDEALPNTIGSRMELFEAIAERATFILVYLSPNFKKDNHAEFLKRQEISLNLADAAKKWSMIPVFESTEDDIGFKNIPYGLRDLVSFEIKYFKVSVEKGNKLFSKSVNQAKKRARWDKIKKEYDEWLKEETQKRKRVKKLENCLKGQKEAHEKQAAGLAEHKAVQMLKGSLQDEYNTDEMAQKAVDNVLGRQQSDIGSSQREMMPVQPPAAASHGNGGGVQTTVINHYNINNVQKMQIGDIMIERNYGTTENIPAEPCTMITVVEEPASMDARMPEMKPPTPVVQEVQHMEVTPPAMTEVSQDLILSSRSSIESQAQDQSGTTGQTKAAEYVVENLKSASQEAYLDTTMTMLKITGSQPTMTTKEHETVGLRSVGYPISVVDSVESTMGTVCLGAERTVERNNENSALSGSDPPNRNQDQDRMARRQFQNRPCQNRIGPIPQSSLAGSGSLMPNFNREQVADTTPYPRANISESLNYSTDELRLNSNSRVRSEEHMIPTVVADLDVLNASSVSESEQDDGDESLILPLDLPD